ncbi:iron-hydroxamate ABC transporter substrate-binding protein [Paenibacillus lentus]|uniref:iron-hydroxamate ABC transporter substrate-binding protein n=1 Tax=Paenibacillus lentus TaxID=1338368 RepID=UPI00365F2988
MHSQHYYNYKRLGIVAPLLLLLTLIVSACGTSGSSKNSNQSQNNHQNEPQNETRTITTINGDVEIPVHPQRIVADQYLGSFIALDIIPVGVPSLYWNNPYVVDSLDSVEDLGDLTSSLEKMVDLKPDLIVSGLKADDNRYEQLSKIAPTVNIPFGELKNAHEELTYFGKLLGKEKEAEAWLANYDRRITAARESVEKVVPAGSTFSIIEVYGKSIYVYGDNFGRGGQAVYQALGLKPPASIAEEILEKQWVELSKEVLPQYAGDYIILTTNDRTLEDIQADPIWSTLDAVKNNRVYVWKEERSWYFDPIAVLSQTEELAAWLTGQ